MELACWFNTGDKFSTMPKKSQDNLRRPGRKEHPRQEYVHVSFSIKAGGNCNRQIKCLLVSVSGSFADSLNHAREGSGRERRGWGMTNSMVL